MPTRPAQRTTPAAEQLVEMLAVRRQLSAEKTAAENASRLLEDLMLQRLSRRRIARLAADIELLDKRLVEIVATDATLAHRYRLLTSMPGVGPVLACTLIALLPELGGMSRKQVAALVGVAPYAFESGTLKGRRCIWGRSCKRPPGALHGRDERQQLEFCAQTLSRSSERRRQIAEGRDRGGDAEDDHDIAPITLVNSLLIVSRRTSREQTGRNRVSPAHAPRRAPPSTAPR